jgi:hypothetical protein
MTTTEFPATPIEFDTKLAEMWAVMYESMDRRERAFDTLASMVNNFHGRSKYRRTWVSSERTIWEEANEIDRDGLNAKISAQMLKVEEFDESIEALHHEIQRWDDAYIRGGAWTRAFLVVTNGTGHVHRSMQCSTTYATTRFHWLTELSDHSMAEIVEKAGERACTVCYPSAPVETRNRPTTLFTPDEVAKQKAREEREAAKVAREAKRLEKALLPDGSTLRVGTERFTTLASARTWLTDAYWWGLQHPSFPESAVQQVAEAVAAKEDKDVATVLAEAEKRAAKRK